MRKEESVRHDYTKRSLCMVSLSEECLQRFALFPNTLLIKEQMGLVLLMNHNLFKHEIMETRYIYSRWQYLQRRHSKFTKV